MMAKTSRPTPTIDSPAPGASSVPSSGSRDSGTSRRPTTSASTISGTLIRNTDPHQKCSSSRPEATGPIAAPPAATPAHVEIALPRSWAGNTVVRIDSVDGITNAAAAPITTRATITTAADGATVATAAPARNTTRPTCSARLRPNRSPSVPAVNSSPANTRA
jgi:hypothetical protein